MLAGQKYPTFEHSTGVPCIDYAELARKRERQLRAASAVKKNPKYGQIRTESRLSRVASHLYLVAQSACHNNCEKYCKSRSILAKPSPFFNSLKNPRANQ